MQRFRDACWRWTYRVLFVGYAVYGTIFRPKIRSAHVLIWYRGKLLVVGHSYKKGLSAPAGMCNRNEPADTAAARELREEVGLRLQPEDLTLVLEYTTLRERAVDRAHVFEVRCDTPPDVEIDNREITWSGLRSPEELRHERLRPIFEEILENLAIAPFGRPETEAKSDAVSMQKSDESDERSG